MDPVEVMAPINLPTDAPLYRYNSQGEGRIVISVPFPLGNDGMPEKIVAVGENIFCPITIENTSDETLKLWSVRIYAKNRAESFFLSVMEPTTPVYDARYLELLDIDDRNLMPYSTFTVWLTCRTSVVGLHAATVNFDLMDKTPENEYVFESNEIQRVAFVMAAQVVVMMVAPVEDDGFGIGRGGRGGGGHGDSGGGGHGGRGGGGHGGRGGRGHGDGGGGGRGGRGGKGRGDGGRGGRGGRGHGDGARGDGCRGGRGDGEGRGRWIWVPKHN